MRWRRSSGPPQIAPLDLLSCLLMVFVILALVQKPEASPPKINTYGLYAVTITWPSRLVIVDLDLYVQDPAGNVVWFDNKDVGQMQLEHDDLGDFSSGYGRNKPHYERAVIRGIVPGEYTANVHVYSEDAPVDTPVDVQLWRLQGQDKLVLERHIIMHSQGDEQTAFRWTLDAAGNPSQFNRLPKRLVERGQIASPTG